MAVMVGVLFGLQRERQALSGWLSTHLSKRTRGGQKGLSTAGLRIRVRTLQGTGLWLPVCRQRRGSGYGCKVRFMVVTAALGTGVDIRARPADWQECYVMLVGSRVGSQSAKAGRAARLSARAAANYMY